MERYAWAKRWLATLAEVIDNPTPETIRNMHRASTGPPDPFIEAVTASLAMLASRLERIEERLDDADQSRGDAAD